MKDSKTKLIYLTRFFVFILFCNIPSVSAIDTVKLLKPLSETDKRSLHKNAVILRALEVTEIEFGAFKLEYVNINMTPSRALVSLIQGQLFNTFIGPNNTAWEKEVFTIKVPIRLGLLSYRLLLTRQSQASLFANINTLEDLTQLNAGLQYDWLTTEVYKANKMKVTTAHKFESLFEMLKQSRFDYIPRAVYEIYDELNNPNTDLTHIIIEPTLALYLPMATYVYVSPQNARLAQRLEIGLHKLMATGEIKSILDEYYAEDIRRANLKSRKIITINNPYDDTNDIVKYKDLWREY